MWWLVLDLVLAVIIRLQMLHVESIVRRTNSTEVESMTDLEANTYIMLKRFYNIYRSKRFTPVLSLRANKLFECKLMWVEESPWRSCSEFYWGSSWFPQSVEETHLGKKSRQIKNTTIMGSGFTCFVNEQWFISEMLYENTEFNFTDYV